MATTLLWGRFVFGIDITFEQPLFLALAIPATILSIGALGFLMAVSFARYRTAWALGSMTEYPIWLICGFLVPISLLPGWVRPISWALAPTWGIRAHPRGGDSAATPRARRDLPRARRGSTSHRLLHRDSAFEVRARRSATLSLT